MAPFLSAWTLAIVMTASSGTVEGGPMHVLLAGRAQTAVVAAIAGALQRFESPSCQRLLTDFVDDSGRPLDDNLSATGLTLPVYVSRLYAVEGDREHGCANERTRAFTAPGSHVIHSCSAHFDRMSEIVNQQMTIIHEILHTLRTGRESAFQRSDHAAGDRALQGVVVSATWSNQIDGQPLLAPDMPAPGTMRPAPLPRRSSWASIQPTQWAGFH